METQRCIPCRDTLRVTHGRLPLSRAYGRDPAPPTRRQRRSPWFHQLRRPGAEHAQRTSCPADGSAPTFIWSTRSWLCRSGCRTACAATSPTAAAHRSWRVTRTGGSASFRPARCRTLKCQASSLRPTTPFWRAAAIARRARIPLEEAAGRAAQARQQPSPSAARSRGLETLLQRIEALFHLPVPRTVLLHRLALRLADAF